MFDNPIMRTNIWSSTFNISRLPADVWATGVLMVQMATFLHPFIGTGTATANLLHFKATLTVPIRKP